MPTDPNLIMNNQAMPVIAGGVVILIIILVIREAIRKGIALWKAGRSNHLTRFIFLFILNTAGILPILYLIFRQKKNK